MKKALFLLSLSLFTFGIVSAQEVKHPKYKISQFQLSFGGDRSLAPLNINQNEFNILAPGALIPANSTPYTTQFGWDAPTLNMNVAFHPLKKNGVAGEYNKNRTFRAGISAQGISASIYNTSNSFTTRIDTLVSAANGSIYGFVDSIHRDFTFSSYMATAVKLDFSYLASTDISKRFSFYSGVGLNFGITLAPRTEIQSHSWDTQRITDTNDNYISTQSVYNALNVNRQVYQNKMGYMAALYVPIGVDFRLGKKNEVM
ncbi:MAG: hypothetical protein RLZZ155_1323, partial [Bacteroidota bacterium]